MTVAAPAPVLRAASLRRRLASMLYESLLLLGVLALAFLVPYLIVGIVWQVEVHGAIEWLHLIVVVGAYFVWFWTHGGQTLAMQTWKIRIVSRAGDRLDWKRALLRYALAWPSLLCLGLGLAWALFDRDRQFLHDRLAGTRVVSA